MSKGRNKVCRNNWKRMFVFRSRNHTLIFWSLIFVFLPFILNAQNNIGVKYFGLSIHPEGEAANAFLMPNRLDEKGYLVLNIGGEISYEHFVIRNVLSVKAVQAAYADCAALPGGFSHLGFRLRIFDLEKHSLYGGLGPTIIYRKNWLTLEGYTNLHRFKGSAEVKWQYLFLWYGGEFEYKYKFSRHWDLSLSFVPGYPDLMSLAAGILYKF